MLAPSWYFTADGPPREGESQPSPGHHSLLIVAGSHPSLGPMPPTGTYHIPLSLFVALSLSLGYEPEEG